MTAPSTSSSSGLGPLDVGLYTATVLIFGSGWLPLRLQLGVVAPEVSGVWRFLIAGLVMFAWVALRGGRLSFPLKDHVLFAALGLTLFSANFITFYYAGFYLASGLLSVLFSLAAVFIPLIGGILTGVAPNRRILIGAVLGVFGVALVFGPSVLEKHVSTSLPFALGLALVGTLSFSFGSFVIAAVGRRGLPQGSVNAYGMFYGVVFCAALALLTGADFKLEWTARYIGSLAYLIVVPTLLGFGVYMTLIRRIGPSRAGYGTVMFPIIALALSTIFEGYHWTVFAAFGVALVLIGNVVVLRAPRSGFTPPRPPR
ncbi:DMT family transporter [Aquabacter sp. L1I39]|uniref:DMT family transporter n=1 Tax=Aquabacter sp. L1I39 TaxID=2820278 RepID=UPI001ADCE29D|nr:DMT family transporter [Aquabacter sp. L1I39]QTL01755.1 DMT family transporter [Aquabacter sp. L1I39]